jgi:hypothetical protein
MSGITEVAGRSQSRSGNFEKRARIIAAKPKALIEFRTGQGARTGRPILGITAAIIQEKRMHPPSGLITAGFELPFQPRRRIAVVLQNIPHERDRIVRAYLSMQDGGVQVTH